MPKELTEIKERLERLEARVRTLEVIAGVVWTPEEKAKARGLDSSGNGE